MIDRTLQLRQLYGIEFPDEFFEFWEWRHGQAPEVVRAFHDVLGMRLTGPFDVLAGRFDGVELRYPAVLHWRYSLDPPEFFTIISGHIDGLHWGYWFDDPGRRPPVVAAWYARDAFELWTEGDTLLGAIHRHLSKTEDDVRENLEYDPDAAADYQAELDALSLLREALPWPPRRKAKRVPTAATPEGMGVIYPHDMPEAGQLLLQGRELWPRGDGRAFDLLEQAYVQLDRPALAAVARAHREHPHLPSVDILDYRAGDYHTLHEALAEPERVRRLEIGNERLAELPDLSALTHLEELLLWGNALTDLPSSLAACQRLRKVNLTRNRLTKIPDVLFELPALEDLWLTGNQIRAFDERLPRLRNLRELCLLDNPLAPGEVDRIRQALPGTNVVAK